MTRKPLMAGNWKMNKTIGEAVVLAQDISNQYDGKWDACDVVVCPPYVDLKPVKTVFEFDRVPVGIGAQNVFWEEKGAFTGEISVPMLKEIVDHHRFGDFESDNPISITTMPVGATATIISNK